MRRARRLAAGTARRAAAAAAAAAAGAAALLAVVLGSLLAACGSCPPSWLEHPPEQPGWWLAAGSCGEVFLDADARNVAATRAARSLADRLGLDVEGRLAVVLKDDRVFVEAWGAHGPQHALDGLQLVDEARCGDTTCVLVRLPAP